MRHFLACFFLTVVAIQTVGCGPRRYSIDPMAWGQDVYIDYEDFEDLKEKELRHAKTMLREPNIKDIPAGGTITVKIRQVTLAAANTKYWSVRVEDPTGKIIVEQKGYDSFPFWGSIKEARPWHNVMLVDLPSYIEIFATVRVFDHLSNQRHDFKIEKRSK